MKEILVMDDEKDMLELCKALLECNKEFSVHTAFNALGGIEILSRYPIDLILTDYKMPGLNGLDFLEKARGLHPHIGFILMTGFWADRSGELEKRFSRLDGFLKKPFTPETLCDTVNQFFARDGNASRK